MNKLKYPVGMQSFPEIRERGFLYVDKSEYIEKLFDYGKYFFLGRPRRFGKSLFISMLKAYFEGRRELFDGLAASHSTHDWESLPVLHLDFTGRNYTESQETLDRTLSRMMHDWEQTYDCALPDESPDIRFENIIKSAYEQTGSKVVILVDEYDKPLLDTIEIPDIQERYRNTLRGIYGNLKKMDSYIEFAFFTGITRFGKLNIFSDINNLNDISMMSAFGGICGITFDELKTYFDCGIEEFAKIKGCSTDEMYELLKYNYDGYHFATENCPDIYNPFSLLSALQNKKISEFWFSTGTPSFLIKRIKARAIRIDKLNDLKVLERQIDNIPFDLEGDPVPILYQSGYLTIKDYNPANGRVTLGYPNREVEHGFLENLMSIYAPYSTDSTEFSILEFADDVENGNIDRFMERIRSLMAGIDYDSINRMTCEQHYQNVLYLLFKLLGYQCHTEYKTATGRIDMTIGTRDFLYIFEFKFDRTAEEALHQIDTKEFLLPFRFDGRKLIKIGVNFSSETKNIDSWISES